MKLFQSLFAALLAIVCFFSVTAEAGWKKKNRKWLKKNAQKEGVVSLPSGLQYKVLEAGPDDGKTPLVGTPCECHYEGKLINDTVFDSSYKRGEPTTFAPNQVIKGWTEAMQLMREGDTWELYVPQDLAYGSQNMGTIKPFSTLIFKLNLIKVKGESKQLPPREAAPAAAEGEAADAEPAKEEEL